MCGICGVAGDLSHPSFCDDPVLKNMSRALLHRGPDDDGCHIGNGIMLAMRRLSIIDLVSGQQPVTNEDKTLHLIFNGEIYNFRELRDDLQRKGHLFASKSDSEVILHAYEEYSDQFIEHLNGMFAFAIWDEPKRRLLIARDRLGIKPMYYWAGRSSLVFGSELKALLANPHVPQEIDLEALDHFLTLEYIPGPLTIFKGIYKLPAGHLLIYQDGQVKLEKYWDIPFKRICDTKDDCIEILRGLLEDAVRSHMVSDVPIGALLSGGIDSSTIVAFMAQASTESIQSFSIGFSDETYNELFYARAIGDKFGAIHHEEILQPNIQEMALKLVGHMDEPFSDFSIFPTYLVSNLASKHVKVVLSGDGGDELFGGYDTYVAQSLDTYYRRLPASFRNVVIPAIVRRIPPQPAKKGLINKTKRLIEGSNLPPSLQHTRWMMFMNTAEKASLYKPELFESLNGCSPTALLHNYFQQSAAFDSLAQQQYVDIKTYLVDDILTKVDRMSMANSLEVRVPFLDHRLVEFAVNLPPHMKVHYGRTKIILRDMMKGILPESVLSKPKEGFSIPIKNWLRVQLKPLMNELLAPDLIHKRGYFDVKTVSLWMKEHLEGRANHSHRLWSLMVLELWHQGVLERERF
jgi:asparagine synthase (glutamine-hydrolysing)